MTKKIWRAGGYPRRSKEEDNNDESDTIKNQKDLIKNYVQNENDVEIFDYYTDDGYTGTDFNRPGFKRMLLDIKNGKINTIIVKDLSRLGRNYIEVGNYLEQIFPLYNVRFISINDNIDSFKDPKSIDNLSVNFKNVMNDEYAKDISKKVITTLNTKRKKGDFIGTYAPFGYLIDEKDHHKFAVDKATAKVVRKIFRMACGGNSKINIVEELNSQKVPTPSLHLQLQKNRKKGFNSNEQNVWNTKKLDRILRNKTYIGYLVQGKTRKVSHKVSKSIYINSDEWIEVPNHHKPLVSEESYDFVQDILYKRDNRVNKQGNYNVFSGHLFCADCGNSISPRKNSKGIEYYYCNTYYKEKTCSKHSYNGNQLRETITILINEFLSLVLDAKRQIALFKQNESNASVDRDILFNRIESIDTKINNYRKILTDLETDCVNEFITKKECESYKHAYEKEIKSLIELKSHSNQELQKTTMSSEEFLKWINKIDYNSPIIELTKSIIDELVENIFIYENKSLKVIFKFENEYKETIKLLKQNKK